MNIQESAVWIKYLYLAPKGRRISRKKFHELYEEYVKHPERKEMLIRKLRKLSREQGKINERRNKNKATSKNKPGGKPTNKNKKSIKR